MLGTVYGASTRISGCIKYWNEKEKKIHWILTSFVQFSPLDPLYWLQKSDCLLLRVGDAIKISHDVIIKNTIKFTSATYKQVTFCFGVSGNNED